MSDTLLAPASRMLWRLIESHGVDPAGVFADAGLDETRMDDPQARFPVENARRAWSLAAERISDPCFGVRAGLNWLPTDLHALGYAFLSSANLLRAINRISRYNEIVDRVIAFESALDDRYLTVSYSNTRPDLPDIRALEDARWSVMLAMCRAAKAGPVSPIGMTLTHDVRPCRAAYSDYFGCDIAFNQPRSSMTFDRQAMEERLPALNVELARINEQVVVDYLDQLHEDDLLGKVRQIIQETLPCGDVNDELVAARLHVSPRTLQRKLADEGTSYKQLLEEIRRSLADRYITDSRLSLTEISFLLGFAEQSVFSRAFRRWFGTSPSEARRAAGS